MTRKKSRKARDSSGVCKLTKQPGQFVASHIIPEALTETVWRGYPLIQLGPHGRPVRRWTSWYDPKLVTDAGEKILSAIDDWAIKFLRQRKLVWSSWGPALRLLAADHMERQYDVGAQKPQTIGVRRLQDIDGPRLRLFFLSLLWRAAATDLWEFESISLQSEELEQLRLMVLEGQPAPYSFYPISLTQYSTRAVPFNQATSRKTKLEPVPSGTGGTTNFREVEIYRFYLDGLVAHVHIGETAEHVAKMGDFFVGPASSLLVTTLPAEQSAEIHALRMQQAKVHRLVPSRDS